jgi:hypothetical protein
VQLVYTEELMMERRLPGLKQDGGKALGKWSLLKPRPGQTQPLALVVAHLVGPVIYMITRGDYTFVNVNCNTENSKQIFPEKELGGTQSQCPHSCVWV